MTSWLSDEAIRRMNEALEPEGLEVDTGDLYHPEHHYSKLSKKAAQDKAVADRLSARLGTKKK